MGCAPSAPIEPDGPIAIDIPSMFKAVDTDGDGFLTKEELTTYMRDRANRAQEEIDALFKLMDKDSDGKITQDEVAEALAAIESGPSPLEDMMAERPAPSAAVFNELCNKSKTPVCIELVEERAITLKQLGLAFKHASMRCRKEGWLGSRPDAEGKWHYVRLKPSTINLYDLCAHVIKPATHRQTLPGSDIYPSYVELVANGAQPPEFFISHFWGESVLDFCACLRQHSMDREVGGGKCVKYQTGQPSIDNANQLTLSGIKGPSNKVGGNNADKPWEKVSQPHNKYKCMGAPGFDAKYWVCAYANRQWNLGADVTEDPSQSSFHRAIKRSKGTVAILDQAGKYWTRIWCDYEVYVALEGSDAEFTFDVYTATPGTFDQCSPHSELPALFKEAVGLCDGVVPCDTNALYPSLAGLMKLKREANFPIYQQKGGMGVQLQNGDASMKSDKTHILNAIAGNTADSAALNAEPPTEHKAFDALNAKLTGRMAAKAFLGAALRGDEALAKDAIAKISHPDARLTEVSINFATIEMNGKAPENATIAALLNQLVAALPSTLEVLHIELTPDLKDLGPLPERCPNLRELVLTGCVNLGSLPDLAPLAPTLKVLNLTACEDLQKRPPDVSKLSLKDYKPPSNLTGFQAVMIKEMLHVMFPSMPEWMVKKMPVYTIMMGGMAAGTAAAGASMSAGATVDVVGVAKMLSEIRWAP